MTKNQNFNVQSDMKNKSIAYHDAGHAIACLSAKIKFKIISISSDLSNGLVIAPGNRNYKSDPSNGQIANNYNKKRIFLSLSGPLTEKFFGIYSELDQNDEEFPDVFYNRKELDLTNDELSISDTYNDFNTASTIALNLFGFYSAAIAFLNYTWQNAKPLIFLNWEAIDLLAKKLLEKKKLSYTEVKKLMKENQIIITEFEQI
jgi:hypothetical protein